MPRATQLFLLLGLLGLLDLLEGCSLDLARLRGDLDAATSDAPGPDAPLSDAPGHDAPADGGAALIDPVLAVDLVGTPSDLIVGPDPDGARIVVDFGSSTLHTATFRGSACVFAGASIVDVAGTWRGATALMDVRGSTDLDILADSGDGSASVLEHGAGNAFEPSAPVTLGTGGVLVALGVGNLDGDALPDLVAVERGRFAVPLVRVGGVFSAESGISTGSGTHVAALVSDVDGMDADDLVTLVDDGGTVFLEIQRNLGTRMPLTFQTVTSTPLGSGAAALAVGASSGSGQRPIAAVVGEQL